MAPWTVFDSATPSSSIAPLPQAVPLWSQVYQSRYMEIVNADGDFNGTCTMTEESIPLLLEDNMCASWFLDITIFCCGAVGGILEQASNERTSTGNETAPDDQGAFEPVCVTTNYHDMLDCYKQTSTESCSSNDVAPWGICNARLADTSRDVSQSNSCPSTRYAPHYRALLFVLLLPILNAILG